MMLTTPLHTEPRIERKKFYGKNLHKCTHTTKLLPFLWYTPSPDRKLADPLWLGNFTSKKGNSYFEMKNSIQTMECICCLHDVGSFFYSTVFLRWRKQKLGTSENTYKFLQMFVLCFLNTKDFSFVIGYC